MSPSTFRRRSKRAFGLRRFRVRLGGGRFGRAIAALAVLAVLTGCSDARPGARIDRASTADWSQIKLPDAAAPLAYDAGMYAMRQWFRLAETDPERGLIQSAPGEYEQKGGTGRIRDAALGFKNRMRRTGTLLVQDFGGGCIVKCKVAVQRLDTADHRAFRSNQQFEDVPNQTPIQQEAGVNPSQDQVWTDMPRDHALERQILDIVRDRLAGGGGGKPADGAGAVKPE